MLKAGFTTFTLPDIISQEDALTHLQEGALAVSEVYGLCPPKSKLLKIMFWEFRKGLHWEYTPRLEFLSGQDEGGCYMEARLTGYLDTWRRTRNGSTGRTHRAEISERVKSKRFEKGEPIGHLFFDLDEQSETHILGTSLPKDLLAHLSDENAAHELPDTNEWTLQNGTIYRIFGGVFVYGPFRMRKALDDLQSVIMKGNADNVRIPFPHLGKLRNY